jgi:mono/diheme cytochrome c family protein
MLRRAILPAVVTVVAVIGWFVWSQLRAPKDDDPRQIALGEGVYRQHCASCHGPNLEGQPNWMVRKPDGRLPAPPHDATGHTWHHATEQLVEMTKHGMRPPLAPEGYQSDMPAFEGQLSDDQVRAVIAYIESRWPDDIRARQRRADEAYRQTHAGSDERNNR